MLNAKTQTTKRPKCAKSIVVLLLLIISLTGCESDESVVENEIKRESKFSKVTFEELPSAIKTKDVFN
ncbi:MAG: hypothetical protein ABF274_12525 [Nonlabens sp.]|uniref:hypothetical protein n=1 Tax=Nonlabens sp. TaxID=1888209 RepID=UPI00321A57BF